jgi:hypothetical protein
MTEKNETPKKGPDSNIVAAIIGTVGTIAVALITIFANRSPSPSPQPTIIPIVVTATSMPTTVPTDTVAPGEPTSTPAPTDTPEPTPTFTPTAIPPVAIGQDWAQDCISTLWQPFPADYTPTQRGDGCWQGVKFFSASKGSLSFLNKRSGLGSEEVYGLFAPLPDVGTVTLKVRLKELTNVDVMMGVFPDQNVTSDGLLITIPAGDPKNRLLVQKNPSTYKGIQQTIELGQGDGYEVTFSFDSVSASAVIGKGIMNINGVPVNATQKYLFLGFKGLTNDYRIEGSFVSLELK